MKSSAYNLIWIVHPIINTKWQNQCTVKLTPKTQHWQKNQMENFLIGTDYDISKLFLSSIFSMIGPAKAALNGHEKYKSR